MCKACVQKFDHHCVWLNQCVGLYNYRFFLGFLFLHAILCTYGAVIGAYILMDEVDRRQLYEQTFVNMATGEQFKADFWIVFNYLMQDDQFFMGVVLLCVVISVMLYLFFGYHMYLIKKGYTTNENVKAQQLKYYLEKTVKFMTKWESVKQDDKEFEPAKASQEYYGVGADWDLKKIRDRLAETQRDLDTINKGSPYRTETLWEALKMIAFPDSYT